MPRTQGNQKPSIFTATVISLGRITIPEQLRLLNEIQQGDMVELQILSVQKNPKEGKKIE